MHLYIRRKYINIHVYTHVHTRVVDGRVNAEKQRNTKEEIKGNSNGEMKSAFKQRNATKVKTRKRI